MHPSKFFEECSIRTGIDVVEVYDENLKEKTKKCSSEKFSKDTNRIASLQNHHFISDRIRKLSKDGKVYGDGEW